jgi:small subunit ribosomal protein S7
MKIIEKFVNHITLNGKKATSEKLIIQSIKYLQKRYKNKNSDDLIKLALVYSTPIFWIYIYRNKKRRKKTFWELPGLIKNKLAWISLAIRFILQSIQQQEKKPFFIKLNKELSNNITGKSTSILLKNTLHQKVVTQKKYIRFYKW